MKKISPYKRLQERVNFVEDRNYHYVNENALLKNQVDLLTKLVMGPPTIMIACEKIVEAAAQVTCSATALMKEVKK